MNKFWSELKRRNVVKVGLVYILASWVILQVTSILAPALMLPDWTLTLVTLLLIVGFVPAAILAWAYELTPEGLKREGGGDDQASRSPAPGRQLDYAIIGILCLGIVFLLLDRFILSPAGDPEDPSQVMQSSIAVLPFVNMSNDPDQVYFSDGISEEILNVLAQIPDLHVTSRSSAFQFRGNDIHIPSVAQKLGVANILEGSVRKSGTRIRITAQLIDATSDRHLWSETFERELVDVFAIQDEISKAIVDALYVHLGLERPILAQTYETDVEAYRLYLLGRHNFEQRTSDSLYSALDYFDQAIAIDASYAPAYSGKADVYGLLDQSQYGTLSRTESIALSQPLMEKALALDPDLAEAHASRGLLLQHSHQFEASRRAYDRAIELNPSFARAWHWKAIFLELSEDHQAASDAWQRAYALDPLSPVIFSGLIGNMIRFGQLQEAVALLDRQRLVTPALKTRMSWIELEVQLRQGNWALAHTLANEAFLAESNSSYDFRQGIAQLSLKAFDPGSNHLSETSNLRTNSLGNAAEAWETYQSLPSDGKNALGLPKIWIWAAVRLGKYQEAIDIYESQSGLNYGVSGPLFSSSVPAYISAPSVVMALRQTGDTAGAELLMAEIESYIQDKKDEGTTWTMSELEARVYALKGEDDKVIAALEQAHRDGNLSWFWLEFSFFDAVRDREDFQAIVRAVDDKVNAERAKLGWGPVD